jgi:hypothetical protein
MRSAGAIGLLALAAVPAPAAAAPLVDPVSVSRSVTVPSGATRSLTLTCPGTAVALHGAASWELGTDSIPGSHPQRWTFRFASEAGDPSRRASAVVRCVRLRLPAAIDGVRLVVGTGSRPHVEVGARSTTQVVLRCDRGQVAVGWGVERGDAGREIGVTAIARTPRSFGFELENRGSATATATPRIRCLERTQRSSSGLTHSFKLRTTSFEDSGRTARHACRRGEYSVSAAAVLDPDDGAFLEAAMPRGPRGALWRFSRPTGATSELVCLARGTTFR